MVKKLAVGLRSVFVGGDHPQPVPNVVQLQELLCEIFEVPAW